MLDLNETTVKEKAMEYELVTQEGNYYSSHSTYRELQKKVNKKISEGWEPQGGVSIGHLGEYNISVCQAMIKRNEKLDLGDPKVQVRRID